MSDRLYRHQDNLVQGGFLVCTQERLMMITWPAEISTKLHKLVGKKVEGNFKSFGMTNAEFFCPWPSCRCYSLVLAGPYEEDEPIYKQPTLAVQMLW